MSNRAENSLPIYTFSHSSYQVHCRHHHFPVLLFNAFRPLDSYFPFKTKYPVEKDFSHSNFLDHAEVLKIPGICLNIWTEPVNNCIHYAVIAKQLNFSTGSVVHSECRFNIFAHIKANRLRNCCFVQDAWARCNSIYSMAANGLVLVRIAYNIIVISIPYK